MIYYIILNFVHMIIHQLLPNYDKMCAVATFLFLVVLNQ